MNFELLTTMLKACDHAKGKKNVFTISDEVSLAVLIEAGGAGAAPIPKVESLNLHDAFLELKTVDASYLLPYGNVVGLKWSTRGGSRPSRTGFHA